MERSPMPSVWKARFAAAAGIAVGSAGILGLLVVLGAALSSNRAAEAVRVNHAGEAGAVDPPVRKRDETERTRAGAAEAPIGTVVQECRGGGTRVFTDRPCPPGTAARIVEIPEPNLYRAAPVAVPPRRRHVEPEEYRPRSGTAVRKNDACAAIEAALEELDARMRRGYRSREGEVLRARWHRLKEEHHEARCLRR